MNKKKMDIISYENFNKIKKIHKKISQNIKVIIHDEYRDFGEIYYFHNILKEPIQNDVVELVENIIKNTAINDILSIDDLENIIKDFLMSFFVKDVGRIDSQYCSLYGDKVAFKYLGKNYISDKKLQKIYILEEKFKYELNDLIIEIYINNKHKTRLSIFPMYFFQIESKKILNVGKSKIYSLNEESLLKLKQDYLTYDIDNLILELEKYKITEDEGSFKLFFCVIEEKGSLSKSFEESINKVQLYFSFLKILINKYMNRGHHAYIDNYFQKKPFNQQDGIYRVITETNEGIYSGVLAWDERDIFNGKRKNNEYHYLDNFFQHVIGSVRNSVSISYLTNKSENDFLKDLKYVNSFINDYSKYNFFSKFKNASIMFGNARKNENPISQVIMGVISIETILFYKKEEKITEKFKRRLCKLLDIINENDKELLLLGIGGELNKFIEKNIYKYRSELVHGSKQIIDYNKNFFILNISAYVIIELINYIVKNKIENKDTIIKLLNS